MRHLIYLLLALWTSLIRLLSPERPVSVQLTLVSTGQTYDLDATEIADFWDELQRVTLHPPERGLYEGVAPDCSIYLQTNRGSKTLEIYGQTVLYDPARNLNWQFYMGLILIEWVDRP